MSSWKTQAQDGRLAQLKADPTQVGHDFDPAFTDDDRAGGEILARGASG
jgi:hypothetical protein